MQVLEPPLIASSRGRASQLSEGSRARSPEKHVYWGAPSGGSITRSGAGSRDFPRRPLSTMEGPVCLPPTQGSGIGMSGGPGGSLGLSRGSGSEWARASEIARGGGVPNAEGWPKAGRPVRRSVTASVDEKIREIKRVKAQRYRR